jgi:ubiquitin-activating enzyme E1 C
MKDVGKSKAEVAAERINARVSGAKVSAHHGRIEDFPPAFYLDFHVIVLGLDSLEARRYMNTVICSFLGTDPSALFLSAPPRRAVLTLRCLIWTYKNLK